MTQTNWEAGYHDIAVWYEEKAVHVKLDIILEKYLSARREAASELAAYIRSRYEQLFHQPLDISEDSLAVEIIAHVFVDKMASALETLADRISDEIMRPVIDLMGKVREHTDVIDCGESSVDGNRFVWDMLVPFRGIFFRLAS